MKRLLPLLALLAFAGCGSQSSTAPRHLTAKPVGCMGPCSPTLKVGLPPKAEASKAEAQLPRIPDVSEWQPCVNRAIPTVFRLAYGSRQDTRAFCDGRYLAAHHVWRAGYVYLLPGSWTACTAQANAGAQIVAAVGGVDLVIADGEEKLGAGFQRCFLDRIHQLTHLPTADYTGCFSGLERIQPLWVPSYGAPPNCGPFKAWQYTDGTYCGEPYVTDCSFDYGITSIGRHPQPSRPALEARRRALRRALLRYGCRARVRRHESLGPRCRRWFAQGNAVNRQLGGH